MTTAEERIPFAMPGHVTPLGDRHAAECLALRAGRWVALLLSVFTVCCMWGPAAVAQQLFAEQHNDQVVLRDSQHVLLVYQVQPGLYKPYVKQWFTPGGLQVLEDSPPDHVHHHGLMLAVGVNGVDFWGEVPAQKPGRQVPRGQIAIGTRTTSQNGCTTSRATIQQTLDWQDAEGTRLLEEQRKITWQRLPDLDASVITWESRLAAAQGQEQVELWGRHYFGLGIRIGPTGDVPAEFLNSSGRPGKLVRGSERLCRATWCACRAAIGRKKFTLAAFDHPDNPRRPATFFTMNRPFAYLSATLDLKTAPLKLAAGKPITLRYGLALWDGHVDEKQISRAAELWRQSLR